MSTRRKVTMSFNEEQFADLEALMKEDGQTNFTYYGVYLIQQEKKRRLEVVQKKPVGRPKKGEEEVLYYPSPDLKYGNRAPYTKEAWDDYWVIHSKWEKEPPLPPPLTKEELKKWDM